MVVEGTELRTILEGFNWVIQFKQAELADIKNKTEKDYESLRPIHELLTKSEMNWREKQLDEIYKKQQEIETVQALYKKYNSSQNQILVVPRNVKINMNISNY